MNSPLCDNTLPVMKCGAVLHLQLHPLSPQTATELPQLPLLVLTLLWAPETIGDSTMYITVDSTKQYLQS